MIYLIHCIKFYYGKSHIVNITIGTIYELIPFVIGNEPQAIFYDYMIPYRPGDWYYLFFLLLTCVWSL